MTTKCLYLIIALNLFISASAQSPVDLLNNYSVSYPAENVYLQTDNSYYAITDTIWFKAYLKANLFPSDYSKNLYVDWYDATGELMAHQSYPIMESGAAGQFVIPANLKGNYLSVLAYTKWMLNDGYDFLFHKTIPVRTATRVTPDSTHEAFVKSKNTLHFFPEGGNLVAGVINKIAFKATDQYGDPVQISGVLKDNAGNVITNISTIHDGMGYFYLKPKAGISYIADWSASDGTIKADPLPEVQPVGITMEVKVEKNSRKVIIRKGNNIELRQIHLLVTMNGLVDYLSNVKFKNHDSIVTSIPVNDLPSGIVTFTVLDNDWNPLAERISYVSSNDINTFRPQVSVTQKNLNKKGLNQIALQYTDSIAADLSISVTDAAIPADTSSNILSNLLLTGMLKGKVYNPTYYFSNTTLEKQQQLDLVMLTNGWRKYQWHEIVKNETPSFQYTRDSNYFFLNGTVNSRKNKHPEQLSFLSMNKKEFALYDLPVNSNNNFTDSSAILFDTTSLIYHPEKGFRNIKFSYAELPQAAYKHYPFRTKLSPEYLQQFEGFDKFGIYKTTLPDIIVTTKAKLKVDSVEDEYASGAFKNTDGFRLELESKDNSNLAYNFTSLPRLLTARLPGYWGNQLPKYVFLNESLTTPDVAMQIPLPDIAFVKYFPRQFVLAPGNGGGIMLGSIIKREDRPPGSLAIYTKLYSSTSEYYDQYHYQLIGYTISKEYYEPDYDSSKDFETSDLRKTLYWNPMINMNDKDNKEINISFYNNDVAKKIRIVVEGLKKDGTPVHIEKIVE